MPFHLLKKLSSHVTWKGKMTALHFQQFTYTCANQLVSGLADWPLHPSKIQIDKGDTFNHFYPCNKHVEPMRHSLQLLIPDPYYSYSILLRGLGLIHCPLKPMANSPLTDPVVTDEGQAGSRPLFCQVSAKDTHKKAIPLPEILKSKIKDNSSLPFPAVPNEQLRVHKFQILRCTKILQF